MKKLFFVIIGCLVFGCSSDVSLDPENNLENLSALKYTLRENYDSNEIVFTQEYIFDEDGKVVSEKFTNYYEPQHTSFNTFEYNEKGQVIKEIRDGQVYLNIVWTNDFAEVFNMQGQKIAEFNFDGERLIDYKTEVNTDNVRIRKLNYSNQNVISMANETEVLVEYLDYDLTKRNPLNLIKSIGILRIDYKPYFKNIFETEKVYPFAGDDFNFPLTYFDYNYTFDAQNRVYQIEDGSSIYIQEFTYE